MEDSLALADRKQWAQDQFGQTDLGDRRRTRRLVRLAALMAGNSSGSIPQQTGGGADMKAAYRLFDAEEVTHAAICQPHFEQTRGLVNDRSLVFLLQDTMILDLTGHRHCRGLGPVGKGGMRQGLHQQNVLAADPTARRPIGLMYQRHHLRTGRPKGSHENRHGRRTIPPEERESYWWIAAIRTIGQPPPDHQWVHVGDRGEDLFGVYDEARRQGADWLIRAGQNRRILTPEGEGYLLTYARRLPSRLRQRTTVRRSPTGGPEEVELSVAGAEVRLQPSRHESRYRRSEPVACWVVRVWEPNPPAGFDPLEWLLCTSLNCDADDQLRLAAQGYGLRWMIEEFHKCEKTGCQVEMRCLQSVERLEPLIGLLSVLAIRLLQLKFVARDDPDMPARQMFDESMVRVMARYLGSSARTLTVGRFWKGIGRLGGHPGRKGDGPIGWLRAWRGWQSFQLIMLGAHLSSQTRAKGCG
jgi:hypothetical protein